MAGDAEPYTVPFIINGDEYRPEKTFDVIAPETGKLSHRCGSASVDDARKAVDAAAAAFPAWRHTTPSVRRDIFLRAADIMLRRKDELVGYVLSETGATESWASFNVTASVEFIRDVAGRISGIESSFIPTRDANVNCIVMREPYGVVLSIAPWNAPYILGTRSVAFPVAAGNTVVLKGTELAPRTMWAIASVFHEAGLPAGVINSISHEPSAAAALTGALIADPRVRKVNFTGSTNVGRAIGRLAGENLKPVVLELGGKAPAIVWDDADLDVAARECAVGAFLNSGQICMSTERILVHRRVRDEFVAKLRGAIGHIFPASGPAPVLINSAAVDKNRQLLADARSKGASVEIGDADGGNGATMRPVVLGGVTPEMDIYRTESFGPTVSLIDVETEEEAVRIANDTEYGLTSAVFTTDLRRALRFARGIEAGAVHCNSMSVHDEPALPHGGARASGFGRFNAQAGLNEWLWTKNFTFDI